LQQFLGKSKSGISGFPDILSVVAFFAITHFKRKFGISEFPDNTAAITLIAETAHL
jgi:hypothetical protein